MAAVGRLVDKVGGWNIVDNYEDQGICLSVGLIIETKSTDQAELECINKVRQAINQIWFNANAELIDIEVRPFAEIEAELDDISDDPFIVAMRKMFFDHRIIRNAAKNHRPELN